MRNFIAKVIRLPLYVVLFVVTVFTLPFAMLADLIEVKSEEPSPELEPINEEEEATTEPYQVKASQIYSAFKQNVKHVSIDKNTLRAIANEPNSFD